MISNLVTRTRQIGAWFSSRNSGRCKLDSLVSFEMESKAPLQDFPTHPDSPIPSLSEVCKLAVQPGLVGGLKHTDFYASAEQDAEQDRRIGDFRGFIQNSVSKEEPSIEIGPSYNPLLPKRLGFNVTTVDHASQEELKTKYRRENVNVTPIEHVDVIWTGGMLSAHIRDRNFYSIVASHMIEHAPNFIGFLQDCSELLARDRCLFLIIPDKRFCFDFVHPITDVAKVTADHRISRQRHSLESLLRNSSNIRARFGGIKSAFWGQHDLDDISFLDDDPRTSMAGAVSCVDSEVFFDSHENYFTPSSFALLIAELRYLSFVDLSLVTVSRTRGCEFLVVMKKTATEAQTAQQHAEERKFLHLNILREEREWLGLIGGLLDGNSR